MACGHHYLYHMNGKIKEISLNSINFLLILLWTYAAVSKLSDYQTSRDEMSNQALPPRLEEILVWAIPLVELTTASLLLFSPTRLKGTLLSLFLLVTFTLYIVLVKLNFFDYVPCSCGGIISKLSWEEHFYFNLSFLAIATIGFILQTRYNEPAWRG